MKAERWFTRELKSIAPELYPLWFPQYGKWMIVKDVDRQLGGLTDRHPINGSPVIVELVLEDEKHRPLALSRPVLEMIRQLLWEKNHHDKIGHAIRRGHEREDRRANQAHKERLLLQRDFLKKAWHFIHSETIHLPGKELPGKTQSAAPSAPGNGGAAAERSSPNQPAPLTQGT